MRRYGTLGTLRDMRISIIIGPGFFTHSCAAFVNCSTVVFGGKVERARHPQASGPSIFQI